MQKNTIGVSEARLKTAELEVVKLGQDVENKGTYIKQLQTFYDQSQKELSGTRGKVTELTNTVHGLQRENNALTNNIKLHSVDIKDLNETMADM
jgi:chromosome segregation ATPase